MRALLRLLAFVTAVGLLVFGTLDGSDIVWMLSLYAAMAPITYILFSMVPRQTIGWRRNTWKISAVLVVGFIALSLQLLRQQFIVAEAVAAHPRNTRNLAAELRNQRGRVLDRNGAELAGRIVAPDGRVRRTYPEPSAGYVVGHFQPGGIGSDRLEEAYDAYLTGERGDPIERTRSRITHRPMRGNDLHLTLDVELQTLGQQLLGERRGAIVALNPKTGEVLALVSSPAYDPASLVLDPEKPRSEEAARARAAYATILADEAGARLTHRALQGRYSPGSTFKTVTAAAGLALGRTTPDRVYTDTGRFVLEGFVIEDPNRPDESRTRWTLTEAYKWSLNAVFAELGIDIDSANMREYARRFGYEDGIPFDLPVSRSTVSSDPGFLSGLAGLASTAIGQGQLQATPMHVALISAAIANGGVMPQPYLVREITTPGGATVFRQDPKALHTGIVPPRVARQVAEMMVAAVESGNIRAAGVPGVEVAGKSGTAQLGGDQAPHAWFTGFAPADNPQIAVAVLVENGGFGSSVAAPLGSRLIAAYLRRAEGE